MSDVFRAPRAFYPPASLLGRALRRAIQDPLRAGAAYWVVLALLAAGGLMAVQWGWLWLRSATPPDAFAEAALRYIVLQAAAFVAFTGLAFAGWRPQVEVTLTSAGLRLRQGRRVLEIPRAALRGLYQADATEEHRTLRRHADVHRFVATPYDPLLVLDAAGQPPIVLGLPAGERARLEQVLSSWTRALRPPHDLHPRC